MTLPAGHGLPAALERIRALDPTLPIMIGGAGVREGTAGTARHVPDAGEAIETLLRAA